MVHALGQIIEKLGIMQIVFVTERQKRRGRRRRDVKEKGKRKQKKGEEIK